MTYKKLLLPIVTAITFLIFLNFIVPVKSDAITYEIISENMLYQTVPGTHQILSSKIGVDLNQRTGVDIRGLDLANELGATMIRTDFFAWHGFEIVPGEFDFTIGDQIIQTHENYGFQTILNIHGGNENYTGAWNNPPSTKEELQHYKDYLSAIANSL